MTRGRETVGERARSLRGQRARAAEAGHVLTGSRTDAEDLLQDTSSTSTATGRGWRRARRPTPATRRALVNRHTSNRRKRSARRTPDRPETVPDPGTPDETARVDSDLALWERLATLPPRMRQVLVLRFYEDPRRRHRRPPGDPRRDRAVERRPRPRHPPRGRTAMSDIETRLTNVLRERADAVDFDAAEWTARVKGAKGRRAYGRMPWPRRARHRRLGSPVSSRLRVARVARHRAAGDVHRGHVADDRPDVQRTACRDVAARTGRRTRGGPEVGGHDRVCGVRVVAPRRDASWSAPGSPGRVERALRDRRPVTQGGDHAAEKPADCYRPEIPRDRPARHAPERVGERDRRARSAGS